MQIYENVRPPSCKGRQGNSGFIPIAQSDITGDLAFRFFFMRKWRNWQTLQT